MKVSELVLNTEFAMHEQIGKLLRAEVYFALPYHSWERGTNENTNGLIREFIPKGNSFQTVKYQALRKIVNSINRRPRKVLGYRTAEEIYYDKTLHFSNNPSPPGASSKKPLEGSLEKNSTQNPAKINKNKVSHLKLESMLQKSRAEDICF